jgi:hypothetical protein
VVLVVHDVSDEFARNRIDKEVLKCLFVHPEKETILVLNKIDKLSNKEVLLNLVTKLTGGFLNDKKFIDEKSKSPKKRIKEFDYDTIFSKTAEKLGIKLNTNANKEVLKLIDELKECEKFLLDNKAKLADLKTDDSKFEDKVEEKVEPKQQTALDKLLSEANSSVAKLAETALSAKEFKKDLLNTTNWHLYYKKLSSIDLLIRGKAHWPYFNQVFMVSAQLNDGVEELKQYLLSRAKPGPWFFTRSLATDQAPKDLAEMLIREKLLKYLPNEVPYQLGLETTFWEVDHNDTLNVIVNIIPASKKSNVKRNTVSYCFDFFQMKPISICLYFFFRL